MGMTLQNKATMNDFYVPEQRTDLYFPFTISPKFGLYKIRRTETNRRNGNRSWTLQSILQRLHNLKLPLVPEPAKIAQDQERTRRKWFEHSAGKWLPVEDLKISIPE